MRGRFRVRFLAMTLWQFKVTYLVEFRTRLVCEFRTRKGAQSDVWLKFFKKKNEAQSTELANR